MASHRSRIRTRPPHGEPGPVECSVDPERIEPFLADAAHTPDGAATRVCFPTSERQIAEILRHEDRVLAIGAQSSLTGGATPRGECLLSTARLASLHGVAADRAVAGPGIVLHDLSAALADHDLYYPPVPTYDGATLGGNVSTNAAGAATFKHGSTRDWIERICIVLACGEVLDVVRGEVVADDDGRFEIECLDGSVIEPYRPAITMPDVPKISCGYFSQPNMDLIDLFVGSEGTLGIVSEIEIRVLPRPRWFAAMVELPSEATAVALVGDLRRESLRTRRDREPRGLDVAAIEYLDHASLELLRADGIDARHGVPLSRDAGALLLLQVEIESKRTDADLLRELESLSEPTSDGPLVRLTRLLDRHGGFERALPILPGDASRRANVLALREAVPEGVNRRIREAQREHGSAISKAAADVIVPFDAIGEALRRYREIAAEHGLDCVIWGHISDGNVHPNLIARSAEEGHRASPAILEIGRAAIALGGAPMSEHGVGRSPVKQQLLLDLYGAEGVASMRAVKRALDPRGALAPGSIFEP